MIIDFLRSLAEQSPVRVGPPEPIPKEVDEALISTLIKFEELYRIELPGEPPPFDTGAAVWSAKSLYLASSLVVYRDADKSAVQSLLSAASPDRERFESHYAVDVTMRFLPDLLKLAKSAATDDPLVERLMEWAKAWPLSSVGIAGTETVDATPLRTSPTLMRLYADRVIATGDRSRLSDRAVKDLVLAVQGEYPELCPSLPPS